MTIECSQSVHSIVFTCPLRGGSPVKQAQERQCVLASKNCPGTLFPNRTIYLFYRTQHRWAVFSSGSRRCRFQFMAIEGSHSYLCRRRYKVAMIAEPNWTFASRFLRRKAPAEWRIYEKSSRTGKDSSPIRLFLFLCIMYVLTLQRPLRLWRRLLSIAVSAQTLRFRSFRSLYR